MGHVNCRFVMAPSGSGKTYWCDRAYTHGTGVRMADGDAIIGAANLWPPQRNWWENRSDAELDALAQEHARAILVRLQRNKDLSVAFNSRIRVMLRVLKNNVKSFSLVIPTEDELLLNAERRRKSEPGRYSPSPDEVRSSIRDYLAFAKSDVARVHGVKAYRSWEEFFKAEDFWIGNRKKS